VEAVNKSLHYSTENHARVVAPVIGMDKVAIIKERHSRSALPWT